jgi:hypothetical protein
MDLRGVLLKSGSLALLLPGALLLGGCDIPETESWSGGDLRGVNHTYQEIDSFSVNGSAGPNIGSFGEKGGACCISLPEKWRPGLKADVEWVVSASSEEIAFPGYGDREKYNAWKKNYIDGLVKHRTTVDIPDYGDEKCGLTVHFLPCNQIKVTASCWTYGAAEYPVKDPREMEEPAQCPK